MSNITIPKKTSASASASAAPASSTATSSNSNANSNNSNSSNSNSTLYNFPVGIAGKRELRRALIRSRDPATTIQTFQRGHSLHSMLSRSFGTIPKHHAEEIIKINTKQQQNNRKVKNNNNNRSGGANNNNNINNTTTTGDKKEGDDNNNSDIVVESLDTDPVMTFLSHINVTQYEVHKRISDQLLKQLEEEVRKTTQTEPLLALLQQCWIYSTTLIELRPVLWSVLRQLGSKTPLAVLNALAERDEEDDDDNNAGNHNNNNSSSSNNNENNNNKSSSNSENNDDNNNNNNNDTDQQNNNDSSGGGGTGSTISTTTTLENRLRLKHADIFRPLPPSLKRLCYEADWDTRMSSHTTTTMFDNDNSSCTSSTIITDPIAYLQQSKTTLLYQTLEPHIMEYTKNNRTLVIAANLPYVATIRDRKIFTTQRRTMTLSSSSSSSTSTSTTTTSSMGTSSSSSAAATTANVVGRAVATAAAASSSGSKQQPSPPPTSATTTTTGAVTKKSNSTTNTAGRAVVLIRRLLCDNVGTTLEYRPKLLYAILSVLMAKHGACSRTNKKKKKKKKDSKKKKKKNKNKKYQQDNNNNNNTENNQDDYVDDDDYGGPTFMGGAKHLHCTLVSDLLLAPGGPLPKAYYNVATLARLLDDAVQKGVISDTCIIEVQAVMKRIFQPEIANEGEDGGIGNSKDDKGHAIKDDDIIVGTKQRNNIMTDDNTKKSAPSASTKGKKTTGKGDSKGTTADGGKKKKGGSSVGKDDKDKAKDKDNKDKKTAGNKDKDSSNKDEKVEAAPISNAMRRQLNIIISSGLNAMKDADPQSLFLNPVTDAIAPGYSKIIKQPMCIVMMEHKVHKNQYNTLHEWEYDVKLVFKNCIDYNRGNAGQWFRGEASRQRKVFNEEILPQARRLYQSEVEKRKAADEEAERKRIAEAAPTIQPLEPSNKKRKKEKEEYIPSMPALASMVLADPFVVRIVVARALRELQRGVMDGTSIPAAHSAIPSLLQILHMARWSTEICAIRGRRYFVPASGLDDPDEDADHDDPVTVVPHAALRRYLPLVIRLLLHAELDKRMAVGGDLHAASKNTMVKPEPVRDDYWMGGGQTQVIVSLVEAAMVHMCQPGNSSENSLSLTYPKFAKALEHLSIDIDMWDHRVFFVCLIQALVKHKSKLPKDTRDAVVNSWLSWLRRGRHDDDDDDDDDDDHNDDRVVGTMTSSAHECLILLLNEWASLGNTLLPRDTLLQFAKDAVRAVDLTERGDPGRRFYRMWMASTADCSSINKSKDDDDDDDDDDEEAKKREFAPVKKQYDRMLKFLPSAQAQQWKDEVLVAASTTTKDDETMAKADEEQPDVEMEQEGEEAEGMEEDEE